MAHAGALDWLCGDDARERQLVQTCSFAQFTRRCLRKLGWSAARVVAEKVADEPQAIAALTTAVREFLLRPTMGEVGVAWLAVRAAFLHRTIPTDRQAGKRYAGWGWWHAACLLAPVQLVIRTQCPKYRLRFKVALRCLAPALQRAVWTRNFKDQFWPACVELLLATSSLPAPGLSTTDGIIYLALDEASAT